MAHLTGNFTSSSPLSPAVQGAINTAFQDGWADPKKQSQASARAAILRDSAIGEVATLLATRSDRLEVIGEPALSHYIALMGFIRSDSTLTTSTIDIGRIRAIARRYSQPGDEIGVDENGLYILGKKKFAKNSVISIQATNGETGANQELDHWRNNNGNVVIDATSAIPTSDLVDGFAATTFDATSWGGPTGLGFIHIEDEKSFQYPLPHLAPIRVPGSYSLPLLIGAAIALNEFFSESKRLIDLRARLVTALKSLKGVTVLAEKAGASSRYLSIIVDDLSSEEVLRSLLLRDVAVDAGSACSPEDLAPSHVIASMGFPTTGHIRFTLHPHHSEEAILQMVATLEEVLNNLRR